MNKKLKNISMKSMKFKKVNNNRKRNISANIVLRNSKIRSKKTKEGMNQGNKYLVFSMAYQTCQI